MTVTTDLSEPRAARERPTASEQAVGQDAERHRQSHVPLHPDHRLGRGVRVLGSAMGMGLGHARRRARVGLHHRLAHRARWRSASHSSTVEQGHQLRAGRPRRGSREPLRVAVALELLVVLDRGAGRADRVGGTRLGRRVRGDPALREGAAPDPDGGHGRSRAAARGDRRGHPVLLRGRLPAADATTPRSTSASRSTRSSSTPTTSSRSSRRCSRSSGCSRSCASPASASRLRASARAPTAPRCSASTSAFTHNIAWVIATLLATIAHDPAGRHPRVAARVRLRPQILLHALAAAVIGKMENFTVIFAASCGIGIVESRRRLEQGLGHARRPDACS